MLAHLLAGRVAPLLAGRVMHAMKRDFKVFQEIRERPVEGCTACDQHIVVPGTRARSLATALRAARKRRRIRLRTTALPSFFVTVKPKRGPRAAATGSAAGFVSTTQEGVAQRAPPLSRRNSARFFNVSNRHGGSLRSQSIAGLRPCASGRQALTALGPAAGENANATRCCMACGSHGGAYERAGWADKYVSRHSPS